jgi:hypothetical protein
MIKVRNDDMRFSTLKGAFLFVAVTGLMPMESDRYEDRPDNMPFMAGSRIVYRNLLE